RRAHLFARGSDGEFGLGYAGQAVVGSSCSRAGAPRSARRDFRVGQGGRRPLINNASGNASRTATPSAAITTDTTVATWTPWWESSSKNARFLLPWLPRIARSAATALRARQHRVDERHFGVEQHERDRCATASSGHTARAAAAPRAAAAAATASSPRATAAALTRSTRAALGTPGWRPARTAQAPQRGRSCTIRAGGSGGAVFSGATCRAPGLQSSLTTWPLVVRESSRAISGRCIASRTTPSTPSRQALHRLHHAAIFLGPIHPVELSLLGERHRLRHAIHPRRSCTRVELHVVEHHALRLLDERGDARFTRLGGVRALEHKTLEQQAFGQSRDRQRHPAFGCYERAKLGVIAPRAAIERAVDLQPSVIGPQFERAWVFASCGARIHALAGGCGGVGCFLQGLKRSRAGAFASLIVTLRRHE